jgi:hypothetical protein
MSLISDSGGGLEHAVARKATKTLKTRVEARQVLVRLLSNIPGHLLFIPWTPSAITAGD